MCPTRSLPALPCIRPDKPTCGILESDYFFRMAFWSLKPTTSFLRKLRSAVGLGFPSVALVMLAWLLLWPARIAIALFPLRFLARFYGRDHGANAVIPIASTAQISHAHYIATAIALAAKYSPASANCYPQALLARLLLWIANLPHALFFGLERGSSATELKAHAWVMVGPVAVTGRHSFENHTVVRCYLSDETAR
jgi:Transglutaminase-like superfamily